ncbi:hypothetical protein PVAP13_8KG244033 [Panicum virgatum]|uniref:AAA+ ATPase domain-containing protein n=1 Tax=Panicum virgatum TaxID=38727 RepID=A0A8T0PQ50_PANVG|nr:hypothetical protein PVAP13_8KG244033 [Panicum virgatum]KAG2562700.1 hypothetical protein PVAP13_8KG244033 [Panicum virgatum]
MRMASALIGAAFSLVLKALSPVMDPVLEAWAACKNLGPNVMALKMELLCVKAVLEGNLDMEIHNAALEELLQNLHDLAYDAEDVLDELDYFRIQDELDGTFDAVDKHPKGCAYNLVFNTTHSAKAVGKLIWPPACCSSAAAAPGASRRRRKAHGSISSPAHTNQLADEGEVNGCMRKLASGPSNTIHAVSKCLPCSSLPPVHSDDDDNSGGGCNEHAKETTKLEFNRVEVSKRIGDILEKLQPMCQRICMVLGALRSNQRTVLDHTQSRLATTSKSIEPKLYGRGPVIKSIIHDITQGKYSGQDLTVLPIVGPGGMGKTALAQHIYHSQELLGHFDAKVWICVSLKFNVDQLLEGIEKQISKVDNENRGTAAELIEQRLKSKRFFLVLDDMWECSNKDEWKRLLLPLKSSQKKGNIIIVTTRRPAVAETVTKTNDSIELGGLAYEEFKELFLAFVFDDEQSRMDHPELVETGDKIMEKLKGSPLAAKTVCTLLRKHLDFYHWKRVLESQEWKEQKDKNDIMPALKLSYDYLPFYLQPCFSYCALFPQDYKFGREELIHLWIGLDVLHLCGENKRIEDIGLSHLEELVDHGFLKNEEENDGQTYYVIHDLLHELALKVSSREFLSIYSYNVGSIQVPQFVRHLSINIDDNSVKDKLTFDSCRRDLSTLHRRLKVENLHTLMLFGRCHGSFVKTFASLFKEAKFIRVLFLSGASYNMEDLLPNFWKLIHLRYLRIEIGYFYKIELPSNISLLYHLKVLDLQSCNVQNFLPRDITNLTKLRYLLVRNNEMHSSIFEVGKLKWLQELRRFVVKNETQGFELRQIGDLEELCGSLLIDNLEKVEVKEEAAEAKLTQKGHLHELELCWDTDRSTKDSAQDDQVLENLKPNSNLLKLSIRGHGGATYPSWLGDEDLFVKNLESLHLDDVSWENVPPLGGLWLVNEHGEEHLGCIPHNSFQNLKRLEFNKVPRLKKWVESSPCHSFPHLEVLVMTHCSELTALSFSHSACCQRRQEDVKVNWFPKLKMLVIEDCPKLLSFAPVPWTSAMCYTRIQGVGLGFWRLICKENYHFGYSLEIDGKDDLDSTSWSWDLLAFDNLTELKRLEMNRCPPLPLHHLQTLPSLKILSLQNSSTIVFPLVEGERHAKYQFPVECIIIGSSDASAKELTQLLAYFRKLSDLRVGSCAKITGLGVVEKQATATPAPPSLATKADSAQTEQHQQQDGSTKGEDEGLLLLPPQLQSLEIRHCPSLRSNPIHYSRETLPTGGGQGLQGLRSLQSLKIGDCPRFLSAYSSSSSTACLPFPASLKRLSLYGAVGMATLLPLSNLTSLEDLAIRGCGDLRVEGLHTLLIQGGLTKLTIRGTPNLFADFKPSPPHEQELSSSSSKLKKLHTDDVAGLLAAPICSFTSSSLTELDFWGDREVERLTKEQEEALQLLTSLERTRFWHCSLLQCLPAGLHRLPNLKRLVIFHCAAIRSLPKDGLPGSLQELEIDSCPAIRSMPKECLPSSLQKLVIVNCPAIGSLPKVGDLPSLLRELDVSDRNSEELRRQCRKLIGTIPIVRI